MCCLLLREKNKGEPSPPAKKNTKIPSGISGKARDSPGIITGQSRESFVYVFPCVFDFAGPD